MFDIGMQELVIIFIVALLVFGPKRLPEVGKTLGQWLGELRRGVMDAKYQMEKEFDETKKTAEEIGDFLPDDLKDLENTGEPEETGGTRETEEAEKEEEKT
jgi:Tat protein translocase TatB subunit